MRLKYAYVIKCERVVRDGSGRAVELLCTHDPATRGGVTPEAAKRVKGIIQWVSATHALPIEVTVIRPLTLTCLTSFIIYPYVV